MKNVLQKMAQYEQKEIETKLSGHDISLSSVSELEKNFPIAVKMEAEFDAQVKKIKSDIDLALKNGKKLGDLLGYMTDRVFEVRVQAEELGLDYGDLPIMDKIFKSRLDETRIDDLVDKLEAIKLP
jgi:hypothetical protein